MSKPLSPADRLALAMCVAVLPGSKPCKAPCNACRVNSAAVAHELAVILRERYGSSTTADWLDGVEQPSPLIKPQFPAPRKIREDFL